MGSAAEAEKLVAELSAVTIDGRVLRVSIADSFSDHTS
jgi:hypothetical protein